MKNKFLPAVIAAAAISMPIIAGAEPVSTFEAQSSAYGLNAAQYVSTYDGYSQIYCTGQDAYTYTSTNVRSLPDASSEKRDTLEGGTRVKIWGYTDNGWSHVFFVGEDGQAASGYIRSDLLDLQAPQAEGQPAQQ